jgi:hypothetical protein
MLSLYSEKYSSNQVSNSSLSQEKSRTSIGTTFLIKRCPVAFE